MTDRNRLFADDSSFADSSRQTGTRPDKFSDLNHVPVSNPLYTALTETSLPCDIANSKQISTAASLDGKPCHTEQLRMSSPSLTKMPAVVPDIQHLSQLHIFYLRGSILDME